MKKQLFFAVIANVIFFNQAIEKRFETVLLTNKSHKAFIQGQKAFELIKKIWNVHGSTIDDINNKIINYSLDKSIETIEKILEQNTRAIPSTEIINLISTIKDLKTTYIPITANLTPNMRVTLKEIFNVTKNIYKKLIESQDIVEKYNASTEIIGIGTSYDNLAEIFLATLASFIKAYNNSPGIEPLSPKLQQSAAEKNADKKIQALEAKLAVTNN